jgi:predicted DNA-binding transcriptional regulator AlpA
MTHAEVAEWLRVSPRTLCNWQEVCEFPEPCCIIDGRTLYSRSEVRAWLDAQFVRLPGPPPSL